MRRGAAAFWVVMRRIAVLVGLALMLAVPSAASADPPSAHAAAVCADHETQAEAQNAADTIDADGDGRYCESLPCPCAGDVHEALEPAVGDLGGV